VKLPRFGHTDPLNGNNYEITLGGKSYILKSAAQLPTIPVTKGWLDDVQVLFRGLVRCRSRLTYANPGTTIPDVAGSGTGGLVVHYDLMKARRRPPTFPATITMLFMPAILAQRAFDQFRIRRRAGFGEF